MNTHAAPARRRLSISFDLPGVDSLPHQFCLAAILPFEKNRGYTDASGIFPGLF